jgi:hypothetical protein
MRPRREHDALRAAVLEQARSDARRHGEDLLESGIGPFVAEVEGRTATRLGLLGARREELLGEARSARAVAAAALEPARRRVAATSAALDAFEPRHPPGASEVPPAERESWMRIVPAIVAGVLGVAGVALLPAYLAPASLAAAFAVVAATVLAGSGPSLGGWRLEELRRRHARAADAVADLEGRVAAADAQEAATVERAGAVLDAEIALARELVGTYLTNLRRWVGPRALVDRPEPAVPDVDVEVPGWNAQRRAA